MLTLFFLRQFDELARVRFSLKPSRVVRPRTLLHVVFGNERDVVEHAQVDLMHDGIGP